ncbi:unnamed protein product [Rotaria sp. Silwood1]|nr:unnamed protein product [Rotaria sp. Silwood1]CAF1667576.1 unnamed protein product [Rotaria sp. Silwood1]CAF3902102.1 unnamed protein product [Rotaria sp. Silwood1]CAF4939363.1 unnamed protein product [Rotaria sp. Silwood1]
MAATNDGSDSDIPFEFKTYEEFKSERLKLNHENTLKLWYSLPSGLPTTNNPLIKRYTLHQQQTRIKNIRSFISYANVFRRTFRKKKIRSKGFHLWNDMFNVPPLNNNVLYGIYQSLGRITNEFLEKGKRYDSTIDEDQLFKAGRTVWFMIAFQTQMNLSLTLTDSIFGYNMLYPYTDDLVDCNDVSREAKKDFARIFYERLLIGESNYNPKSHFNGQQSNVAELNLPPSLQPYADRVGKIFDMVNFIENDWIRNEHQGVYMGLATIHESQMKSTMQHAQPDNGYAPTMAQIEQISAEKGGASLIAAVFLIEGRLTRAKMAYLEYLGFGLQLLDDLQDVEEDMKNNHRTIFTQSLADGQTLDAPTARLIQYCYYASAFEKFPDDQRTVSNARSGETLAHYVRASMIMFSMLLILEAVSRLPQYYSEEFYREISTFCPLPFDDLKVARVEKTFWTAVRDQLF